MVLQALALGRAPWLSIVIALSFAAYGVIRKRVAADAQTGILIECIVLSPVAIAILAGIAAHGGLHFGRSLSLSLLLLSCGPATVIPLTMFAFAARRLPLNVIGFIQFLQRAQDRHDINGLSRHPRQFRVQAGSVGHVGDQAVQPHHVLCDDGQQLALTADILDPPQRLDGAADGRQWVLDFVGHIRRKAFGNGSLAYYAMRERATP